MEWDIVEAAITQTENLPFKIEQSRSIGGGSINSAYLIEGNGRQYFVKVNAAKYADMFAAEAEGLLELQKAAAIRVPLPVCWDTQGTSTFIVLEYLPLANGGASSAEIFGQQLAALHQESNAKFGWYRNNTIGSTQQINLPNNSWIDFYRENRLEFQIALAESQGHSGQLQKLGERICDNLECFFTSYDPQPSLLHGDLWSGNYAYDINGSPVIFDPAVYYGDREADLAMTQLFGGFPADFYQAYNAVHPLDAGYAVRKDLYNLYHILNHLNLFGGGYYSQSLSLMQRLLAEI